MKNNKKARLNAAADCPALFNRARSRNKKNFSTVLIYLMFFSAISVPPTRFHINQECVERKQKADICWLFRQPRTRWQMHIFWCKTNGGKKVKINSIVNYWRIFMSWLSIDKKRVTDVQNVFSSFFSKVRFFARTIVCSLPVFL